MKRIPREGQGETFSLPAPGPKLKKPPVRLVSRAGLEERGFSHSPVHQLRLEAEGKFPRRIYLSPARVAWIESEIDDHIARCLAARG
jgi:prophage regulatory protein